MSKQVLVLYPDMVTTVQYDKYQQVEDADFMGIVRMETRSFWGRLRWRGPMQALWQMQEARPRKEESPTGWMPKWHPLMVTSLDAQDWRELPRGTNLEIRVGPGRKQPFA